LPDAFDYSVPLREDGHGAPLASQQTRFVTAVDDNWYTEEQVTAILDNQLPYYCFGELTYDSLGSRRRTTFCFRILWHPGSTTWLNTGPHNEAD
jgi:hypothetical protein